jgi:hypothetical protein
MRIKQAGHADRMSSMRNAYKLLEGKSEDKRPLERPRCRWGIKLDLQKIGCGQNRTGLVHKPVEGSCEQRNEP